MPSRSPSRSPSPTEPARQSANTSSSPSLALSRISSARSSRAQRRRTSVTGSVQMDECERLSDDIWMKTQQEWEALKRLRVRRAEQDAWVQLLSEEREARLAVSKKTSSRRGSLDLSMQERSIAFTPREMAALPPLAPLVVPQPATDEHTAPMFVHERLPTQQHPDERPDGAYQHWRHWFRGIYTDAKVGSEASTTHGALEASCCLCWKRGRR